MANKLAEKVFNSLVTTKGGRTQNDFISFFLGSVAEKEEAKLKGQAEPEGIIGSNEIAALSQTSKSMQLIFQPELNTRKAYYVSKL